MTALNISSFIWGIADDVLRDVYVRGKYRDVILPMTVIRRLDAVLEPTKDEVRAHEGADGRTPASPTRTKHLRQASGEAFYNTSLLPAPRPHIARAATTEAKVRLPSVPRRLLAQRPRGAGQVRVP